MTPEQFLQDPAAQRAVNQWHINDILSRIESNSLSSYLGQSINGVPVTVEGMVAVAHLGGFGGLVRFLQSGGEYNPSDAYGTSLTDYLRRHGEGGTTSIEPGLPVLPQNVERMREIFASGSNVGEGSVTFLPDERGGSGTTTSTTAVEQAPVNATVTPEQSGDAPTARRRREDQQSAMDPRIQELIETLTQSGRSNDALQRLEELAREAEEARRND